MTEVLCVLCGASSREASVTTALIRWREPAGRLHVVAAPRCQDRAACRRRVEAAGEAWDVVDAGDVREDRR